MNIITLLKLLLKNNYELQYDSHIESLIIKIDDLNCKIIISTPKSIGFLFCIYSFDSTSSKYSYHSSDSLLIIPYLNKIINEVQNSTNLLMASNEGLDEYNHILHLFQLILSEQPLPEGYFYEFENNRNNETLLILTHHQDSRRHRISFSSISDKLLNLKTLMGILNLSVYIEPNKSHPDYDLFIRPFNLMLPAYDLPKYSMLKFNNEHLINYTSIDTFIEELTNSITEYQHPMQIFLQHHFLNEKLIFKEKENYDKKLKI